MTDDIARQRARVAADREQLAATLRLLASRFDVPARAEARVRSAGRAVWRHTVRGPYVVPAVLTLAAAAAVLLSRRHRL